MAGKQDLKGIDVLADALLEQAAKGDMVAIKELDDWLTLRLTGVFRQAV